MNPTAVKDEISPFEDFVCGVVRPIQASARRKKRIYEELNTHLREAYEIRLKSGDTPAAAIDHTLASFGEIDKLRKELQAEVPRAERILCTRLRARRPGETDLHYAVRYTIDNMIFLILMMTCASIVNGLIGTGIPFTWNTLWKTVKFFAVMIPVLATILFTMFRIDVRRFRLIKEGNIRKAYIHTLFSSSIVCAITLAVMGSILFLLPQLREDWPYFALGALSIAAIVQFLFFMDTRHRAKKLAWEPSQIEF